MAHDIRRAGEEHAEKSPPLGLDGSLVATIRPAGPDAAHRLGRLLIPVEGVTVDQIRDSFDDPRDGRTHEALDIMAPRGTRVRAAAAGRIEAVHERGRRAGDCQFDPTATFAYYYAHLDGYAPGVREGGQVRQGEALGYVAQPETPRPRRRTSISRSSA